MHQRLTWRVIGNKAYVPSEIAASTAHPRRGLSQSIVLILPSESRAKVARFERCSWHNPERVLIT
jgi:hypothetical protein